MSQRLLSACEQYFEQNCSKPICYDDLRPYVEYLSNKEQEELCLQFAAYAKSKAPIDDESEVWCTKRWGNNIANMNSRLGECLGWHRRSMH